MLNTALLSDIDGSADAFAMAEPFRHVVVENFFQPDIAEQLLSQFPTFQNDNARNMMGKLGGKAVVQDLPSISAFYADVAKYLTSREFLRAMSGVTGIPNLKPDRKMSGAGTHENLHGQELDPHVDFNMLNGWHRRLNIIVYLNKEWRSDWGGSIELHSDPRNPGQDRIKSFEPAFNRALIFETNEYSWHGFRRIQLPENKRDLSRKSLSIYLYTDERPASEKAPRHRTFYVPRPLPPHLVEGHTLTAEDVAKIRELTTRRDHMIEYLQNMELADNRRRERLIKSLVVEKIPANSLLYRVLRKGWRTYQRVAHQE